MILEISCFVFRRVFCYLSFWGALRNSIYCRWYKCAL